MPFKPQLKADVLDCLLNADEFAEEVAYTPAGEPSKVIRAVVVRQGLVLGSENANHSLRNQVEVYIANDAGEGVTRIDRRDDRIELTDIDGTLRQCRINEVVGHDDGIWHLLVGW